MNGDNNNAMKTLDQLQNLDFPRTEVFIGDPMDGTVKIEVKISNDAPKGSKGSEIVFMGVGLVVIHGMGQSIRHLNEKIKTTRSADSIETRQQY
jgi:hypothetical protein